MTVLPVDSSSTTAFLTRGYPRFPRWLLRVADGGSTKVTPPRIRPQTGTVDRIQPFIGRIFCTLISSHHQLSGISLGSRAQPTMFRPKSINSHATSSFVLWRKKPISSPLISVWHCLVRLGAPHFRRIIRRAWPTPPAALGGKPVREVIVVPNCVVNVLV